MDTDPAAFAGQYSRRSNVYPLMGAGIALPLPRVDAERGLAEAVKAHGPRLRAFVRRQVSDLAEVDDIVQDTLLELVSAHRLVEPIEHLAAWLLRVARNRIVDRYRSRARRSSVGDPAATRDENPEARVLEEWLAPAASGPEAAYARSILGEELLAALDELPADQREVFIAHEVDGLSFKELSASSGIGLNTLLGRKHAAVRYLRQRLRDIRSEFDL